MGWGSQSGTTSGPAGQGSGQPGRAISRVSRLPPDAPHPGGSNGTIESASPGLCEGLPWTRPALRNGREDTTCPWAPPGASQFRNPEPTLLLLLCAQREREPAKSSLPTTPRSALLLPRDEPHPGCPLPGPTQDTVNTRPPCSAPKCGAEGRGDPANCTPELRPSPQPPAARGKFLTTSPHPARPWGWEELTSCPLAPDTSR